MGRKRTSSRPTYGEAARNHVSSVVLTAAQFRTLKPRVADYVNVNGVERTNFIMESFRLVWDGEDIMWDVKELWPSKEENPRWHREKKVRCQWHPAPRGDSSALGGASGFEPRSDGSQAHSNAGHLLLELLHESAIPDY